MVFHGRNVAIYSIISVCSCLACMWLFYRFLKQMKKCIGSWLVVILGISDFFYSANVLLEEHFHEIKIGQIYIFAYIHNFSICFSILWASAISFIVYKSLSDRYSNQKVRFASTLVAILAASFIFTLIQHLLRLPHPSFYCLLSAPLLISLIVTIVFYQKSINVLKDGNTWSPKCASIYIRNLRYFSLAQLLTYGPTVLLSFIQAFWIFEVSVDFQFTMEMSARCLASASGLISTLLFSLQGGFNHKEPSLASPDNENDLTVDIV